MLRPICWSLERVKVDVRGRERLVLEQRERDLDLGHGLAPSTIRVGASF
jgi:hypothetical protein